MATLFSLRRAQLGSADPLIALTAMPPEGWLKQRRIAIGGASVVEVGNTCDTCEFYFALAGQAIGDEALGTIREALAGGLGEIDDAITGPFGALLPEGAYIVALLECVPVRVEPRGDGDYFYEEQAVLEGFDAGDKYDEPHLANTHYYRLAGRSGFATGPGWYGANGFGYEFIVPLVQPLDPEASASYAARIDEGLRPTAVAFSLLDVKQRHDRDAHWCMAHYLLDGHHKVDASAALGRPITLLALVPLEGGFCTEEQLARFFSTYEGAAEVASAFPAAG